MMNFVALIILAIVLGIFTSFGLNLYSKLVEKRKNDFQRGMAFLVSTILFIFVPGIVLVVCFDMGDCVTTSYQRFIALMAWLIPVWVFIFINWKALTKRLSALKQK